MCKRCAEIRRTPARDLVLFEAPAIDYCRTQRWYEREAEYIRTMAIIEHAKAGHPKG